MKRILLLASLILPLLFSCQKDKFNVDPDNLLIGVWNQSEYQDNVIIYSRQHDFAQSPCYKFNADGTLLERKISGWCATPPVSYADYDGTWTMLNDTIMQISSGYWGGISTYKLDVESLTEDNLKVSYVYDNK